MSTQRRRVLENSGLIIPADGVYIEGLDGKAYTVNKWKGGNDANSIIVASGDVKFRVALTQASDLMRISSSNYDPLGNYMKAISSSTAAIADYDGAGNTAKILQMQPSTRYAAGYCDAFVFPDGKTKGYLPSFGQLYLICKNKSEVNMALSACGGTVMDTSDYYWSSTFGGAVKYNTTCWTIYLDLCGYYRYPLYESEYVRPFADIS